MLIPDDDGVLHIAILTEISPPVTTNVAADVKLYLYTKYVLVYFQVNLNGCRVRTRQVTKTPQILVGVPVNIRYGWLQNTSKNISTISLCFTNRYSKRRDFCR